MIGKKESYQDIRKAIRVKYNALKEEMEKFGKKVQETDEFLEQLERISELGGKENE